MQGKPENLTPIMRRIAADIDQYERRKIDLRTLIDFLMDESARIPEDWNRKQDLEECWSEMEIIYALAANQGKERLSENEAANIEKLISDLRNLIRPFLRRG